MAETASGWSWLDHATGATDGDPRPDADLARAFAACFRGGDGERVLSFLRAATLERALGPEASEAQLRHLEGQRQLVMIMTVLIRRGRG